MPEVGFLKHKKPKSKKGRKKEADWHGSGLPSGACGTTGGGWGGNNIEKSGKIYNVDLTHTLPSKLGAADLIRFAQSGGPDSVIGHHCHFD